MAWKRGLPDIDPDINKWQRLPDAPGVYAIYLRAKLVYVGSSVNIRKRVASHFRMKGELTASENASAFIKYKTSRRFGDWLMDEVRLIRRLRPAWNIQRPLRWRSSAPPLHRNHPAFLNTFF